MREEETEVSDIMVKTEQAVFAIMGVPTQSRLTGRESQMHQLTKYCKSELLTAEQYRMVDVQSCFPAAGGAIMSKEVGHVQHLNNIPVLLFQSGSSKFQCCRNMKYKSS